MNENMILSAVGELRQTFLVQFCQLEKRLEFICEHKQPDIIETGGVKNITNYYYAEKNHRKAANIGQEQELPKELRTPKAEQIMQQYVSAGLLDDKWQPKHISWAQSALLAKDASDRLNIDDVWRQFSLLWNINSQSLRSFFNRAMNQKKTLRFLDMLKKIHETQL